MDLYDRDQQIIRFLMEHKDEISEESLNEFIASFPYGSRINLHVDLSVEWGNREIDSLIAQMQESILDDTAHEYFYGDVITQGSSEFISLYNFLESRYHLGIAIVRVMGRYLGSDPALYNDMSFRFEEIMGDIIKDNLSHFSKITFEKGFLRKKANKPHDSGPKYQISAAVEESETKLEKASIAIDDLSSNKRILDLQLKMNGGLSGREIEILKLVAEGNTNKEIAMKCNISVSTVKNHVSNILGKLNLGNRTEISYFVSSLRED